MSDFKVVSDYSPAGDQPQAVAKLAEGVKRGDRFQTLLGITGSGKSATIAWTIQEVQRPTLILAPNKSLAAQLTQEMREFFPENRVEYFVSYYDYYQPEAYIASSDTYIEKDSSINDEIDRLRHSATAGLLTRRDTIVVASVSCIYGMGNPEEYKGQLLDLSVGVDYDMRSILRRLVDLQFDRNDMTLGRGKFRVRGDTIEVHPSYEETVLRIEMFGDTVDRLTMVDPLTGETLSDLPRTQVFPATHYVAGDERMRKAVIGIEAELQERLAWFEKEGKLLEAQRLRMRTQYDLEMIQEVGYCNGIENYSMHIDGRSPGEPPFTLLDYFPKDFLLVIDESHVAVPQLHGQFMGDRSRKDILVEHGFRLPSARDNRPLQFEEVLGPHQPVHLLVGHAFAVRDLSQRTGRRADRATHWPRRSRGHRSADEGTDRRPDRDGQRSGHQRRPHPGHHVDEEDGGRSHRVPVGTGSAGPLSAQQHRHHPTHRDPARPAPRRVRRAGRHQPVA